jgi:hypothetical protein
MKRLPIVATVKRQLRTSTAVQQNSLLFDQPIGDREQ